MQEKRYAARNCTAYLFFSRLACRLGGRADNGLVVLGIAASQMVFLILILFFDEPIRVIHIAVIHIRRNNGADHRRHLRNDRRTDDQIVIPLISASASAKTHAEHSCAQHQNNCFSHACPPFMLACIVSPFKAFSIHQMFAKPAALCYDVFMNELIKNQIHTVLIEGYTSEAMGVCRIDGRAVFVPRAIPGERWEIRIVKVTKTAVYARGEKLLSPVPSRVEPACPYYGKCGGCDTWHMNYEEELRFKLDRVNAELRHIGRQTVQAQRILGSDNVEHYRNKGIFAVAEQDGSAVYGFYRERSHELIPMDECLIQKPLSSRAAAAVTAFMNKRHIPAYQEDSGQGTVRHVFTRQAVNGTDAVVCLVAARGFGADTAALVDHLRTSCPELTGIVLNINKTRGNTVLAGDFHTLWGRAEIQDTLCGHVFTIAPQAFFQINPPQAEKLYAKAVEYAALGRDSLALDLFCGAGTISLCLAEKAGHVIGAEIVPEAIANAKANAAQNRIQNVEFLCADAGEAAAAFAKRGLKPEVVVVDPPRKGMDEAAIRAVCEMTPERIVYVSCNPATLARDILRFSERGYTLQEATAVDMFPRTCHVESVVLLTRAGMQL